MEIIKNQLVAYFFILLILAVVLTGCGGGGSDSSSDSNTAPVASDITTGVNEGDTITIDIAANVSDAENALDLTSIVVIDDPSEGSLVINSDGSVDYTHNGTETLSDVFTYTMSDADGSISNLATVNLEITPVNDTPTISGTPTTTVAEGSSYSFIPTSGDEEGNTLLFSINLTLPTWLDFNTSTGALTGTPSATDLGTIISDIVITVDDQQGLPNSTASLPPFDVSVLQGFNEALYAAPSVSSSTAAWRQYQANDGIDTIDTNGWVAPESAWIQLDFDSTKSIYRVVLTDILGTDTQVLAGNISFSDGTLIEISAPLPDDGTPQEFVFSPKQTDWVKVTLTQAKGVYYGLAEIAAYSVLDPGQTQQIEDLFNDGNAGGWTVDNTDCQKGTSAWDPTFNFWTGAGNQFRQTGDCRGITSTEGVEVGTYQKQDFVVSAAGMDLRLQLRSDDSGDLWVKGAMGVLFGHQDHNNYYRLDVSQMEGHRKLWKKQAGAFTELNTSPQSYLPGDDFTTDSTSYSHEPWVNLRIVHQNGVILVYMDGEKIMAAEDATFNGGQIALFCARNQSCSFDNIALLGPTSDPIIGMYIIDSAGHSSGEYFVTPADTLDVSAVVSTNSGFSGVEFVLDEGTSGEILLTDDAAPFTQVFTSLLTGDYTIRAYLLDESGNRLADSEAAMELPWVGTGGIHLIGLGDSITGGLLDDIITDDTSNDGRNTSGGYQPVLNNLLLADNGGKPVTVVNEGIPGETSAEAVTRISAVLARNPSAQAYLVFYGANDAGDGVTKAAFKANIQQLIDAITAAQKEIILAKAPPNLSDQTRDALIQLYNEAIDELVDENGYNYIPSNFHIYFDTNQDEMADHLHPNGEGYKSMGILWCESLNGQPGMQCIP